MALSYVTVEVFTDTRFGGRCVPVMEGLLALDQVTH